MKVLVLCLFVVAALSLFSEDLTKKYSIEVLQQGEEGTLPKKGDKVKMHYAGTLKDGTEFDSSYKRNSPLPLSIGSGQVIKCWDEVGLNMEVGTKVRVLCPSDTAYGSRGVGPIPANSDLIFVIERVEWSANNITSSYNYSFSHVETCLMSNTQTYNFGKDIQSSVNKN